MRAHGGSMLLLALLFLVTSLPDPAAAQQVYRDSLFAVTRTEGIHFATEPVGIPVDSEVDLLLDLYEPVGDEVPVPHPGLVLVHGAGSWRARPLLIEFATQMAARGYTVISIDYRENPQKPVPGPEFAVYRAAFADSFPGNDPNEYDTWASNAQDATSGFRWLVDHADELGVDPRRITMGGISRGASITMSVAYIIDDFGVTLDPPLRAIWAQSGAMNKFDDKLEGTEAALCLLHGTADQIVHISLGERIADHARRAGLLFDFAVVEGGGHFLPLFTRNNQGVRLFDRIVNFLHFFVSTPVGVDPMSWGAIKARWATPNAAPHR